MKMLDEVIMCLEGCGHIDCDDCPYHYEDEKIEVDDCAQTYKDALHYLKEYKIKRERIMAKAQDCEDAEKRLQNEIAVYKEILTDYVALKQYWAEQQANNPLTWSELKQMEGKPVWVEYNFQISDKKFRDNSKRWCVIREFEHWHDTEIIITDNGFVLSKNEQVTDWQAYRKEKA